MPYFKSKGVVNEGQKKYELSNHLGNVLAVINDRKQRVSLLGEEYFEPVVISAQDYFPFGQEMGSERAYSTSNAYRYGFNGKEKDQENEFGNLTHYDYGARIYNPSIGRFLSQDPLSGEFAPWTPYHYAKDNPILRLDQTGKWDITVHAFKDRTKYGYGIAIVTDRHGKEVYRFKVRLQGTGGSDRMVKNSDTPTGVYDIPDKNSWLSGGNRKAYGANPRLILTPESGEILESGRDLIRIHGGRQEIYNSETEQWEEIEDPSLKKTHGCLRCFDEDIATLKSITDRLEASDEKEFGGKLRLNNDLQKTDLGYSVPDKSETIDESLNDDNIYEGGNLEEVIVRPENEN